MKAFSKQVPDQAFLLSEKENSSYEPAMGFDHSFSSQFSSFASTFTRAVFPAPAGPVNRAIGQATA